MQFEEPLFHIHLNVDYPLTYWYFVFSKLSGDLQIQKKNSVVPKPSVRYR
jgi:molecular chaperone HtpG